MLHYNVWAHLRHGSVGARHGRQDALHDHRHVSAATTLNIYTHSEAECERKLAEMIVEEKSKIAAERERLRAGA